MARAASHRQEQASAYQKGLDMGEPKESKLGTRNEYTKITALHVADQQPMLSPPVCAKLLCKLLMKMAALWHFSLTSTALLIK